MKTTNTDSRYTMRRTARAALLGLALAALTACTGPAPRQQTFNSAGAAVDALVAAARADQSAEMINILGPEGEALVYSGDAQADERARDRFVTVYDGFHELQTQGNDRAVLIIGEKKWPFPIPVVRRLGAWYFDTPSGQQEILDRRIGRNELDAMQVCRAIVDAQRDYAERIHDSDGIVKYAARLVSSPGLRDGLYWPVQPGEAESPIGPLLARARAEGYEAGEDYGEHEPYHGYYYKMLMRQGPNTSDGAYEYMVDGKMIGGFALVAFPASYGNSGIMTFIVNQDGIVYQKNLGAGTVEAARAMESFDPDSSWSKVPE